MVDWEGFGAICLCVPAGKHTCSIERQSMIGMIGGSLCSCSCKATSLTVYNSEHSQHFCQHPCLHQNALNSMMHCSLLLSIVTARYSTVQYSAIQLQLQLQCSTVTVQCSAVEAMAVGVCRCWRLVCKWLLVWSVEGVPLAEMLSDGLSSWWGHSADPWGRDDPVKLEMAI